MFKEVFVKIFKSHHQKLFLESTMGRIVDQRHCFQSVKSHFLPTVNQSLILRKARLAQTCGKLYQRFLETTCKIHKKLAPVNSEGGEVKCVQRLVQAAFLLPPKWKAGVALDPGETVIIKYTFIYLRVEGIWPFTSKGPRDPQPGCQTATGQNILKTNQVHCKMFQARFLCSEIF